MKKYKKLLNNWLKEDTWVSDLKKTGISPSIEGVEKCLKDFASYLDSQEQVDKLGKGAVIAMGFMQEPPTIKPGHEEQYMEDMDELVDVLKADRACKCPCGCHPQKWACDTCQNFHLSEQVNQSKEIEKTAMNIVYQIGDLLYEALPNKIAHKYFVDARQATNDKAIDFVMGFLVPTTVESLPTTVKGCWNCKMGAVLPTKETGKEHIFHDKHCDKDCKGITCHVPCDCEETKQFSSADSPTLPEEIDEANDWGQPYNVIRSTINEIIGYLRELEQK